MKSVLIVRALLVAVLLCQTLFAQEKTDRDSKLNSKVLAEILDRAKETDSDAVVIWKDGKLAHEAYFEKERGRIESMSATKSVVALAFGLLLADGKLTSLDEPVHKFFPEWNQGLKAEVTIHHLLTQRSGLQCNRRTTAIYRAPDFVQFALAADLLEEPGTQWRYNNKGCNLLPGIVSKIAGQRMDKFIGKRIFEPLGITDWSWSLDKAGNPHGMSGLQIRPEDFVKVGQLMLNEGKWEGRQILPAEFVTQCVNDFGGPKPTDRSLSEIDFSLSFKKLAPKLGYDHHPTAGFRPSYGLLWWVDSPTEPTFSDRLLKRWKDNGVDEPFLKKMSQLKGLTVDELWTKFHEVVGEPDYMTNIIEKGQLDWDVLSWNYFGFSADGYLGQYLVVIPKDKIVAVRMRRTPKGDFDDSKIDSFKDFKKLVRTIGENRN